MLEGKKKLLTMQDKASFAGEIAQKIADETDDLEDRLGILNTVISLICGLRGKLEIREQAGFTIL